MAPSPKDFQITHVSRTTPTKYEIEHVEDKSQTSEDKPHHEAEVKSNQGSDDVTARVLELDTRVIAEKKLVRKLDRRLLPAIVLIFIMNYIDVRHQHSAIWSI